MKRLYAIRGATCCDNTKEEITQYVCKMFNEIVKQNELTAQDIVSIQFTMTKDLNVLNPATALRNGDVKIDVSQIPLFCAQEPEIVGGMEYVIRVMVQAYREDLSVTHNVYINGAERLRPDFFKN